MCPLQQDTGLATENQKHISVHCRLGCRKRHDKLAGINTWVALGGSRHSRGWFFASIVLNRLTKIVSSSIAFWAFSISFWKLSEHIAGLGLSKSGSAPDFLLPWEKLFENDEMSKNKKNKKTARSFKRNLILFVFWQERDWKLYLVLISGLAEFFSRQSSVSQWKRKNSLCDQQYRHSSDNRDGVRMCTFSDATCLYLYHITRLLKLFSDSFENPPMNLSSVPKCTAVLFGKNLDGTAQRRSNWLNLWCWGQENHMLLCFCFWMTRTFATGYRVFLTGCAKRKLITVFFSSRFLGFFLWLLEGQKDLLVSWWNPDLIAQNYWKSFIHTINVLSFECARKRHQKKKQQKHTAFQSTGIKSNVSVHLLGTGSHAPEWSSSRAVPAGKTASVRIAGFILPNKPRKFRRAWWNLSICTSFTWQVWVGLMVTRGGDWWVGQSDWHSQGARTHWRWTRAPCCHTEQPVPRLLHPVEVPVLTISMWSHTYTAQDAACSMGCPVHPMSQKCSTQYAEKETIWLICSVRVKIHPLCSKI